MDDEPPAKKKKIDNLAWIDTLWDSYTQEECPQYAVIGAFEKAIEYGCVDGAELFLKKGVLNLGGGGWLKNLYGSGYRSNNFYSVMEILKSPRNRYKNLDAMAKLVLSFTPVSGKLVRMVNPRLYNDPTGLIGKCFYVCDGDHIDPLCCDDVVYDASKVVLADDNEEYVRDAKLVIIMALWTLFYEIIINGPLEGFRDANDHHEIRILNFYHCYRYAQQCGLHKKFDSMPFTGIETEDYKKLIGKYMLQDELQNNQRLALLCGVKFLYC